MKLEWSSNTKGEITIVRTHGDIFSVRFRKKPGGVDADWTGIVWSPVVRNENTNEFFNGSLTVLADNSTSTDIDLTVKFDTGQLAEGVRHTWGLDASRDSIEIGTIFGGFITGQAT